MRKAFLVAALGLTLASCAGVSGPRGNDTGGIIPWSPESQRVARDIADANCGRYGKTPVLTSEHRVYGDYITYTCKFAPPRERRWYGRGYKTSRQ